MGAGCVGLSIITSCVLVRASQAVNGKLCVAGFTGIRNLDLTVWSAKRLRKSSFFYLKSSVGPSVLKGDF